MVLSVSALALTILVEKENIKHCLCEPVVGLFPHYIVDLPLAEDTPQTNADSSKTGEKGQIIGEAVAGQAIGTLAVTLVANDGVPVVDGAV